MAYKLVIGNKNTSSWSLRPWLAMRRAGIAFEEVNIDLRAPDAKAQILEYSPSGKVPALLVGGGRVVWDSLAILEQLAEAHPALWPRAAAARALARSVSAEMHRASRRCASTARWICWAAGRRRGCSSRWRPTCAASWRSGRTAAAGTAPAARSCSDGSRAADAMYAPVASRFRTYLPDLAPYGDDGTAQAYVDAIFALPEIAEWERGRAPGGGGGEAGGQAAAGRKSR